jgi:D-3-phosphoglycerate dehydrogenase
LASNTVVVIDTGYDSYDLERRQLQDLGFELRICPDHLKTTADKIAFASDAVGLFIRGTTIDQHFLQQFPELRAIVRYGVGYDNVDIAAATSCNIRVAIVKGYGNNSVSDHAIALMFACARALPLGHQNIISGFGKGPRNSTLDFSDKTLGIVGLGRIGGTLCRKAAGLFKSVIACDPYIGTDRFRELGATDVAFETLLAESHVISLHCNLTEETRHLIDAAAFEKTSGQPVIVNTARGPVIKEQDLLAALKSGIIHSAGIDVWEQEPPQTATALEIIKHPKVIATGHYAYFSVGSIQELQRRAGHNMARLLVGETVDDCLNP